MPAMADSTNKARLHDLPEFVDRRDRRHFPRHSVIEIIGVLDTDSFLAIPFSQGQQGVWFVWPLRPRNRVAQARKELLDEEALILWLLEIDPRHCLDCSHTRGASMQTSTAQ